MPVTVTAGPQLALGAANDTVHTQVTCLIRGSTALFDLCRIYWQSVESGQVVNICTSAPFARRGKYLQETSVCKIHSGLRGWVWGQYEKVRITGPATRSGKSSVTDRQTLTASPAFQLINVQLELKAKAKHRTHRRHISVASLRAQHTYSSFVECILKCDAV